ncbi:MAG: ABC transporter substrate-binding protein [Chloroflexi bacterium]|nr:ABC transporter substrate-binding protein [Chloroflexota bacterium]
MALILSGCGSLVPTAGGGNIQIGVVAPQSGGTSAYGLSLVNGLKLAQEEINAAGGPNGRKIDLVIYDSQSTPTTAASLTQKLVFQDKVPLVIGSASSLETLAMMEITENNKIPLYVPSSASPKVTNQGYKWVWRQSLPDNVTAVAMGNYIAKNLGWKRVAALYENTDYGKPPVEIASDTLKKQGIEVLNLEAFNVGDTDLSAQLLRIRDAKPDGVIMWAHYQEGALALKTIQQLGLNLKVISNQGLVYPAFLELLPSGVGEGMMAVTQFVWTNPDPKLQEYVKKFKAKYGSDPDVTALDAYDGLSVVAEAIKKAGGTDAAKLQEAFRTIKYDGVGGPISYDQNGQAVRSALAVQIEKHTFKVVGQAPTQ